MYVCIWWKSDATHVNGLVPHVSTGHGIYTYTAHNATNIYMYIYIYIYIYIAHDLCYCYIYHIQWSHSRLFENSLARCITTMLTTANNHRAENSRIRNYQVDISELIITEQLIQSELSQYVYYYYMYYIQWLQSWLLQHVKRSRGHVGSHYHKTVQQSRINSICVLMLYVLHQMTTKLTLTEYETIRWTI